MKIGLDIGTNTTSLSYVDGGSPRPFSYGDQSLSNEGIPTAVSHSSDGLLIEQASILDPGEQATAYRYFWGDLNDDPGAQPSSPSSKDLTAAFLSTLFKSTCPTGIFPEGPASSSATSFEEFSGDAVERVVATIPQNWSSSSDPGRSILRKLLIGMLGTCEVQLVSDVLAIAAYYRYCHEGRRGIPVEGNILIWDFGGGGQTASICTFAEDHIQVAAHFTTPAGGNSFDRALISATFGQGLSESEILDLMWKIDRQKREKGASRRLKNQIGAKRVANLPIYVLTANAEPLSIGEPDLRKIGLDDVRATFEGVRNEIDAIFKNVLETGCDVKSIVPVGGFARFSLVREALRRASREFLEGRDLVDEELLDDAEMVCSAANGAALLANDLVTIAGVCDWGISLLATSLSGDDQELSLIKRGSRVDQLADPIFCTDESGTEHLFTFSDDAGGIALVVTGSENGTEGRVIELSLPPEASTGSARWKIGACVNEVNIPVLVLANPVSAIEHRYPLTDILTVSDL